MRRAARNRSRERSRRTAACATTWNGSSVAEKCVSPSMLKVLPASDRLRLANALRKSYSPPPELTSSVANVMSDVRKRGDQALVDYMRATHEDHFDVSMLR